MITLEQLRSMAEDLGSRDFRGFAARVVAVDPVLGETVRLHAEAADGNSPDLADWPQHTYDDYLDLDADSVEEARNWWEAKYAS